MKLYCSSLKNHLKNNYDKESCCLEYLFNLYDISENNLQRNKYAKFLIKTINAYLKESENIEELSSDPIITKEIIKKYLYIISQYIPYYYFNDKHRYVKLLCKSSFELLSKLPKEKVDFEIIQIKNSFANNVGCLYLNEKNYTKSNQMFNKCLKLNNNKIDNAITYNNLAINELKSNNISETKNYLKLMLKEILPFINKDIDCSKYLLKNFIDSDILSINICSINSKNVVEYKEKELISFLLLNYCKIISKFYPNEDNDIFNIAIKYTVNNLGTSHYLLAKFKALNKSKKRRSNSVIQENRKIIRSESNQNYQGSPILEKNNNCAITNDAVQSNIIRPIKYKNPFINYISNDVPFSFNPLISYKNNINSNIINSNINLKDEDIVYSGDNIGGSSINLQEKQIRFSVQQDTSVSIISNNNTDNKIKEPNKKEKKKIIVDLDKNSNPSFTTFTNPY